MLDRDKINRALMAYAYKINGCSEIMIVNSMTENTGRKYSRALVRGDIRRAMQYLQTAQMVLDAAKEFKLIPNNE